VIDNQEENKESKQVDEEIENPIIPEEEQKD